MGRKLNKFKEFQFQTLFWLRTALRHKIELFGHFKSWSKLYIGHLILIWTEIVLSTLNNSCWRLCLLGKIFTSKFNNCLFFCSSLSHSSIGNVSDDCVQLFEGRNTGSFFRVCSNLKLPRSDLLKLVSVLLTFAVSSLKILKWS